MTFLKPRKKKDIKKKRFLTPFVLLSLRGGDDRMEKKRDLHS